MKVRIDNTRKGKVIRKAPSGMALYSDDNRYMGRIGFGSYTNELMILPACDELNIKILIGGAWYNVKDLI